MEWRSDKQRWASSWRVRLKSLALDMAREARLERQLSERDDVQNFVSEPDEWEALAEEMRIFAEGI